MLIGIRISNYVRQVVTRACSTDFGAIQIKLTWRSLIALPFHDMLFPWSYDVMVSILDFESSNPSSSLGRTYFV